MIFAQVVDHLVTLFDNAVAVDVFDSLDPAAVNKTDFLIVAATAEGEEGGTVSHEFSDLGPGGWLVETGSVACSAWSWAGGTDIRPRRAAAMAVVSACVDAVAADRLLGGLIVSPGFAIATGIRFVPMRTDKGVGAAIDFTVQYQTLNNT